MSPPQYKQELYAPVQTQVSCCSLQHIVPPTPAMSPPQYKQELYAPVQTQVSCCPLMISFSVYSLCTVKCVFYFLTTGDQSNTRRAVYLSFMGYRLGMGL
uniref:Uncharacterized protein n=1 Tax=Cacopsylla melanoneura TaxID=428564 RepID=A0A8D8RHD5_9HEMI